MLIDLSAQSLPLLPPHPSLSSWSSLPLPTLFFLHHFFFFFYPVQTASERPSLLALGSDKIWLLLPLSGLYLPFLNGLVNCN